MDYKNLLFCIIILWSFYIYICSTYIYVGLLFNVNNSYTFPHWCIETLVEHHKSHVDGEVHLKIMVEAFFFTINFKYLKEQNKLKFQYINNMCKSRFVHVYKIKINPRLIISFTRKNLFITSKLLRKFLIVINRKLCRYNEKIMLFLRANCIIITKKLCCFYEKII